MADKNAGQLAREKQAKANKAAGVKRKAADESRQKEGQRNRDLAKKRQPYKNFGTTKKTLEERYTPEEIAKMNMKKAPKPVQGAGNMPLSDAEAAKQVEILKAQNKDKKVKKMNRGGMTTSNKYDKNKKERRHEADLQSGRLRMEKIPNFEQPPVEPIPDHGFKNGGMTSKMSKQKGGNTVIVDPAKKSPKSRMKTSGSGSKMAMMKSGGKVRGYGMARGGKACKMR